MCGTCQTAQPPSRRLHPVGRRQEKTPLTGTLGSTASGADHCARPAAGWRLPQRLRTFKLGAMSLAAGTPRVRQGCAPLPWPGLHYGKRVEGHLTAGDATSACVSRNSESSSEMTCLVSTCPAANRSDRTSFNFTGAPS